MTDQELLNAMEKIVAPIKSDLASVKNEVSSIKHDLASVKYDVSGMKVILDVEIRREINLLSEGHGIILDRLPDPMEVEALDARLSAVETVIKKHSRDIQDLKKAQ